MFDICTYIHLMMSYCIAIKDKKNLRMYIYTNAINIIKHKYIYCMHPEKQSNIMQVQYLINH